MLEIGMFHGRGWRTERVCAFEVCHHMCLHLRIHLTRNTYLFFPGSPLVFVGASIVLGWFGGDRNIQGYLGGDL